MPFLIRFVLLEEKLWIVDFMEKHFASERLNGWNNAAAHWLLTHPLDRAHFDAEEIRLMYGDPLLLNLKEHY